MLDDKVQQFQQSQEAHLKEEMIKLKGEIAMVQAGQEVYEQEVDNPQLDGYIPVKHSHELLKYLDGKLTFIDEMFTGADFLFPHNFLTKKVFNLLFLAK